MPSFWMVVLALCVVAQFGFSVCTLWLIYRLYHRLVVLTDVVYFMTEHMRLAAQRGENGKDEHRMV